MANSFTSRSKKRLVEAVYRGHETKRQQHEQKVETYNQSPSLCQNCGDALPYDKRTYKYCSRSCSVTSNNLGMPRHGKPSKERPCSVCQTPTKCPKYCSQTCSAAARRLRIWQQIEKGEYRIVSHTIVLKSYLIEKRGCRCEKCGLTKWLEKPINLTVHHEDGDATNNFPSNLKLQCWNCHSMTGNFGSKNKESTRTYRYKKK